MDSNERGKKMVCEGGQGGLNSRGWPGGDERRKWWQKWKTSIIIANVTRTSHSDLFCLNHWLMRIVVSLDMCHKVSHAFAKAFCLTHACRSLVNGCFTGPKFSLSKLMMYAIAVVFAGVMRINKGVFEYYDRLSWYHHSASLLGCSCYFSLMSLARNNWLVQCRTACGFDM